MAEANVNVETPETVVAADAGSPAIDWDEMTSEQKAASFSDGANLEPETPVVEETPADTNIPAESDDDPTISDAVTKEETPADEGDETVADQTGWIDADTREFAEMMGLTDEDLALFGSRDELDRAMRIIDRKAFAAGKELQTGQQKPPEEPIQKPVEQQAAKKPAQVPQQSTDPLADLAALELGEELSAEDAPKIKQAFAATTSIIKDLQERIVQFEQRERHTATENLRSKVVESLHSLGHTELFGKPGEKLTKEQSENIDKAFETHLIHAQGLLASGRSVAPTPAFLKAAVNLAFGDQITKQVKQQVVAKIQKQSTKRTGGPGAKYIPKEIPDNETREQMMRRLESDPDFVSSARRHGLRIS